MKITKRAATCRNCNATAAESRE